MINAQKVITTPKDFKDWFKKQTGRDFPSVNEKRMEKAFNIVNEKNLKLLNRKKKAVNSK